jgi:hypothetical protein
VSGVDLVQWLTAQLDEDVRIARAACWDEQSDVWTASPPRASYERYTVVDYCDDGVVVVTPENADADGVGRHVAEWDPARVLREIDFKRQILAQYTQAVQAVEELAAVRERLHARGKDVLMTELEQESAVHRRDTLLGVLRLLALPYVDRPGFREEWRP